MDSMKNATLVFCLFVLIQFFCLNSVALAWWLPGGNMVCTESGDQTYTALCSDGEGGAIIVWSDFRGSDRDIYAQRCEYDGDLLWDSSGIPVCTASGDQQFPKIISDGVGGAIIVWTDGRDLGLHAYAQRIDGNGNLLWPGDGLAVCAAADNQAHPQITTDDDGGAIVVWEDYRGSDWNIYAQRIHRDGYFLWNATGELVCGEAGLQNNPQIIYDRDSGAVIAWQDFRSGAGGIYAQRIDLTGCPLWNANGERIDEETSEPQITTDMTHGAIIVWVENEHICGQRISSSGNLQWVSDDTLICDANCGQSEPQIISDGTGGAIITWEDLRQATPKNIYAIYAQKVDEYGTALWTHNGVPVCSESQGERYTPVLASDQAGGAYVAWEDNRNGSWDIYAQHVDASGNAVWNDRESSVCLSRNSQTALDIVTDGSGGAIIGWQDNRRGNDYDIYSSKVGGTPLEVTDIPPSCISLDNYPNPFNPSTSITYHLNSQSQVTLKIYTCDGKLVRTLYSGNQDKGIQKVTWNGQDDECYCVESGVYFCRITVGAETGTKKMILLR